MKYVLGFIFDASLKKVLLIQKNRPEWQKGKINGIGGKVEKKETPKIAIKREVFEETNLVISKKDWIDLATYNGPGWSIELFTAVYTANMADAKKMTDEEINWYPVGRLPKNMISNLTWLIPMCLDHLQTQTPQKITVVHQ